MFGQCFFWLALLTAFGIVTSHFVAAQAAILEEIVILAAFMARIIDTGGNTDTQSATLVIRAMALGQVRTAWRDFFRVLRRDVLVASALGAAIGLERQWRQRLAGLRLGGLDSHDLEEGNKVEIAARVHADQRADRTLEQIIGRISLEPGVTAARWRVGEQTE